MAQKKAHTQEPEPRKKRNNQVNPPIITALYWLPAALYMILIFYMSSFPAPEPVKAVPIYFDIKLVHITEYGILCFLFYFALNGTTKMARGWKFVYSIALTMLYGLTDELHQVFVPGRSGKIVDNAANFIGSLAAVAGLWAADVIRPFSKNK